MKVLTVKNPWAIFIALGWKRIENRDWSPPPSLIGKRIAIHAGAGKCRPIDQEDLDDLLRHELLPSFKANAERLKLPNTVRGYMDLWESMRGRVVAGVTIKAVHASREAVPEDQRVWWMGKCAWELTDIRRVEGTAIKGQLGLWDLPADYAFQRLSAAIPA